MIPLFSVEQNREADIYAINTLQIPSIVLMENAASSIKTILDKEKLINEDITVGIIAGKGNNGGDGFTLARHLINSGYDVKILALYDQKNLKGDALTNFSILNNLLNKLKKNKKLKIYKTKKDLKFISDCDLIIDSILGTGFMGTPDSYITDVITFINSLNKKVVSVDVPSGLNCNNGFCETAIQSNLTITLGGLKKGLFVNKGYLHSGKVKLGNIGIGNEFFDDRLVSDYLIEPEDALFNLPGKIKNINKYSAGKVLIIGGSSKYPNAPIMTATAALKSGAGAIKLFYPKSISNIPLTKLDEVIVESFEDESIGFLTKDNYEQSKPLIDWADVIAVGPGLGRANSTFEFLDNMFSHTKNKIFVVDADALEIFKDYRVKKNTNSFVFTPHFKEFSLMIGKELAEINKDILGYGKEFSKNSGSLLVLKGAPTIIFNERSESFVNTAGNPGMAKFGTGDTLTGIIASFIAQSKKIESSVIAAVYIHSLSADLLVENMTEYSITTLDVIDNLSNTINFLRRSID